MLMKFLIATDVALVWLNCGRHIDPKFLRCNIIAIAFSLSAFLWPVCILLSHVNCVDLKIRQTCKAAQITRLYHELGDPHLLWWTLATVVIRRLFYKLAHACSFQLNRWVAIRHWLHTNSLDILVGLYLSHADPFVVWPNRWQLICNRTTKYLTRQLHSYGLSFDVIGWAETERTRFNGWFNLIDCLTPSQCWRRWKIHIVSARRLWLDFASTSFKHGVLTSVIHLPNKIFRFSSMLNQLKKSFLCLVYAYYFVRLQSFSL